MYIEKVSNLDEYEYCKNWGLWTTKCVDLILFCHKWRQVEILLFLHMFMIKIICIVDGIS